MASPSTGALRLVVLKEFSSASCCQTPVGHYRLKSRRATALLPSDTYAPSLVAPYAAMTSRTVGKPTRTFIPRVDKTSAYSEGYLIGRGDTWRLEVMINDTGYQTFLDEHRHGIKTFTASKKRYRRSPRVVTLVRQSHTDVKCVDPLRSTL